MSGRAIGRLAVCGLAAALAGAFARAQEPAPPAAVTPPASATPTAPPPAPRWSLTATANAYFLPDDENYVMPVVVARRDRLHLETRYNYEARDTGSLFAGYAFSTGTKVEFEAIPMLGAVIGATDGVAAGCTISLTWKQLSVYSENEYVIDFADRESNFFYDWSEVTWVPGDAWSVGLASQRSRVYDTERDLQRGLMGRFTKGGFSATVYWLNPGSVDDFVIASVGGSF